MNNIITQNVNDFLQHYFQEYGMTTEIWPLVNAHGYDFRGYITKRIEVNNPDIVSILVNDIIKDFETKILNSTLVKNELKKQEVYIEELNNKIQKMKTLAQNLDDV